MVPRPDEATTSAATRRQNTSTTYTWSSSGGSSPTTDEGGGPETTGPSSSTRKTASKPTNPQQQESAVGEPLYSTTGAVSSSSSMAVRKPSSTGAGPASTQSRRKSHRRLFPSCNMSRTVALRVILIVSLVVAVAVCATLAYTILHRAELQVGIHTYESIAASALTGAQAITIRKFQGSEVMSTLLGNILPNSDSWPMVSIEGYIPMAEKVAQLSSSGTQSLMVFVDPSRAAEFEEHTKTVYREQQRPEGAGASEFGFGIWKSDTESPYEDGRSRDISGTNSWGGKKQILVPLMMHNQPNASSLLYNVYSEADRGIHIDSMFDCVADGAAANSTVSPTCAVVTDMLTLKIKPGPAGLLFQPVYPAHDPTNLVGFATTSIHWQEVLNNVVPDYVSGLTCVVSTDTASYTYEIRNGVPELVGDGDLHEDEYSQYARSVILNDIGTNNVSSAKYTLTVYPTYQMFSAFTTNTPVAVALGFFGVIAAVALIFLAYDYLMRSEAQQRKGILEMKRRFVRFISHECRTPLNTVCMGLELLESELGHHRQDDMVAGEEKIADEDVSFWHNVTVDVKENAHIAVSILNDLLNYDKLETGTLKLETGRVQIWELVASTVSQFRIQAANKRINLNVGVEPPRLTHESGSLDNDLESGTSSHEMEPLYVLGDDIRLSQVIRNVISNALKFTNDNGTINVSATHVEQGLPHAHPVMHNGHPCSYPRAGAVRIAIQDDGVGLSKEQLALLFGEGIQFDANRLQHGGGSGLGLSIAKGIVEQHCGTIRAESGGIGHGTAFVIELPLYEFPPIEDYVKNDKDTVHTPTVTCTDSSIRDYYTDNEEEDVVEADPPLHSKKRVLVVEDADSSRKMLIRLLERTGHFACTPAADGQEAVNAIEGDLLESARNPSKHVPFDIVLMDFEMPVLRGPEAASRLRALGFEGAIIGVTGNVLFDDIQFFKDSGADDVLSKPISLDDIKASWERYTATFASPSRHRSRCRSGQQLSSSRSSSAGQRR